MFQAVAAAAAADTPAGQHLLEASEDLQAHFPQLLQHSAAAAAAAAADQHSTEQQQQQQQQLLSLVRSDQQAAMQLYGWASQLVQQAAVPVTAAAESGQQLVLIPALEAVPNVGLDVLRAAYVLYWSTTGAPANHKSLWGFAVLRLFPRWIELLPLHGYATWCVCVLLPAHVLGFFLSIFELSLYCCSSSCSHHRGVALAGATNTDAQRAMQQCNPCCQHTPAAAAAASAAAAG
jgi:hypothetical protein